MSKDTLTVVVVKAGELPEVAVIPNELHEFQRIVGGYIEVLYLPDGTALVVNETGKIDGLEPNFEICLDGEGRLWDEIVGDVFFVGVGEEDFVSLTDKEVIKILGKFSTAIRECEEEQ